MRYIPIQSYAAASSKSDVIRNYMLIKVEKEPVENTLGMFEQVINMLHDVRNIFVELGLSISDNTFVFEVMFWGLAIVFETSQEQFAAISAEQITHDILKCADIPCFWKNVSVEKTNLEYIYTTTILRTIYIYYKNIYILLLY